MFEDPKDKEWYGNEDSVSMWEVFAMYGDQEARVEVPLIVGKSSTLTDILCHANLFGSGLTFFRTVREGRPAVIFKEIKEEYGKEAEVFCFRRVR